VVFVATIADPLEQGMRATVIALIGALAVGAALTGGVRGRAGTFAFRYFCRAL
jgi:hypothetical protein